MMWELVWYVRCSIKQPNWNNGSCTHIPVPLSQYFLLLAFLHSILHISHCNVPCASQVPGVFFFTLLVAAKLAATSIKPTFITFLLFFLVSISSHLCFWHLYRVALFTACTPINVSPCNFTFKSDFSTLLDILKLEPSWTANFRGFFVKRVWQRRPISAKDDKFSWSVDDEKAGVQFPQVSGS